jgi:nitrogen regulatory protein PII
VRAVVVITDSEAMKDYERAFLEAGGRGFTIVPSVFGRGRTGLKAGDRVHPGGSSLLFTVVPDDETAEVVAFIKRVRDDARVGDSTKIYTAAVDEC